MHFIRTALVLALLSCSSVIAVPAQPDWSPWTPQIIGGEVAKIDDVPYQLSLEWMFQHICGASIVSEKWAITAAHCVDGQSVSWMRVRAGSSVSFPLNFFGQSSSVERAVLHPKWDVSTADYDVALLALSRPLVLGPYVQPVSLPNDGEVLDDGARALVSGWGVTQEDASSGTFRLRKLEVPVVARPRCLVINTFTSIPITERMLCAGEGNGDACMGDSGGPLVHDGKLVGIVSWGNGCNRPWTTGFYTNVAHPEVRDFIHEESGL